MGLPKGFKHTEETKRKRSEAQKGRVSPMKGKIHSEETKRKLSEARKGNKYNLGKHASEETKRKLSEAGKGRIFSEEHKRKISEAHKGEKSYNWQGGKSFEPYTPDFNERFKKQIKERDGCCLLCNVSFEDLKLLKRRVHIHHIDYEKLNSFPQNCVSLCNSCHGKTQQNRTHWRVFFQSLLKERYGYEYTKDQKMILDFTEEK